MVLEEYRSEMELPFTKRGQTQEDVSEASSAYIHVTMTTGHVSLLSYCGLKDPNISLDAISKAGNSE